MKDVQYDGEDHDDNFDALKRHMQQLSEDYARVVEEPSRGKRIEALRENAVIRHDWTRVSPLVNSLSFVSS